MKAVITKKYGGPEVLEIQDIPIPTINENEILVKVHSTTVTTADMRMRSLKVPAGFRVFVRLAFGFTKPKNPVMGTEFSGVVEKAGSNVSEFKINDKVFGLTGAGGGAQAEFLKIKADGPVVHMPANISFNEAAAIPFGGTASLYFLKEIAKIKSGQKILLNGASGNLGTFGVQLAKSFGAKVIGVASKKNISLLESLGADGTIDYQTEDLNKFNEKFDVIYDTLGKINYKKATELLKKGGTFVQAVAGIPDYLKMFLVNLTRSTKYKSGIAPERKPDLLVLKKLIEEGKIKPVVGKVFKMNEIREAHTHVEAGHKVGSVVIEITT